MAAVQLQGGVNDAQAISQMSDVLTLGIINAVITFILFIVMINSAVLINWLKQPFHKAIVFSFMAIYSNIGAYLFYIIAIGLFMFSLAFISGVIGGLLSVILGGLGGLIFGVIGFIITAAFISIVIISFWYMSRDIFKQ